ncbi:MAG: hypothetical protein ACOVOD_03250 [Rhodoferax sp.]|jgi:hypothetical protein
MTKQPKALFFADVLDSDPRSPVLHVEAAEELRLLHALNGELLEALRDLVDAITGRLDGETIALHNALAVIKKAE